MVYLNQVFSFYYLLYFYQSCHREKKVALCPVFGVVYHYFFLCIALHAINKAS